MKAFKDLFAELFTILAWCTLLGYVSYCTVAGIKTDSVRDAWNILILIAGFVWGSKHQQAKQAAPAQTTTTELNLTATTTPVTEDEKPKE